jgi:hypothetical protein
MPNVSALPFTVDEFLGVFAEYNRMFWFVAAAFWLAVAGALGLAWRHPATRSGALSLLVGVLWLWNAAAYHALLFTRINRAAWLFAALFVVQGVLLVCAGARSSVEYFSVGAWRKVGTGLALYALAYPFLAVAFGHRYPSTPTFGVPCPTAILTIGMLLTARGGVPPALAIVPAMWGLVGGSAAVLLDVWTDYLLLGAGVLLLTVVLVERRRRMHRPAF